MTEQQLMAELGRRFTSFVLVVERPGAVGQQLKNETFWWAAFANRLGLLTYAYTEMMERHRCEIRRQCAEEEDD